MMRLVHFQPVLGLAAVFLLLPALANPAQPKPEAGSIITVTPATVETGSPELIRVEAPHATGVEATWLGRKLEFFPSRNRSAWFALGGVDVESPVGPSTLDVRIHEQDGRDRNLSLSIDVRPAHYRTGTLSVAPKFVEPPPEALKQIEAESQIKSKVFASSAPEPLWRGSFHAPVPAQPTDSFGTRRMFNGKLASIHKGADFRAAMGTPVHAANSGIVVLARTLYYEGNCVIIDHGMGLFTLSMHFSHIDVHEGQRVTQGERLGLSGATGRVTGPHLHWAVRWEGAYLDPMKLLRMNLDVVR